MKFIKKLIQSYRNIEDAQLISKCLEEDLNIVMAKLSPFKRIAYTPITGNPSAPEFSKKSKFGGAPYLRNEKDWPVCPSCKKHMQFIMQLNLQDIPDRCQNGLVQIFYCTSTIPNCASINDAFVAFSKSVITRIIHIDKPSAKILPKLNEIFTQYEIIGWNTKYDYPHFKEYKDLGIDLYVDSMVKQLMIERNIGLPINENKLFGYPNWIQGIEYPKDKENNCEMDLLFQLTSKQNTGMNFGNQSGISYIMQSPCNPKTLSLSWSCHKSFKKQNTQL